MRLLAYTGLFIGSLSAQIFPIHTVQEMGSTNNHINIVFLAEGYQQSEMSKFHYDVLKATNALFNISPYEEYKTFFNVYAIDVPSEQSGTDHPKSADDCPTDSEIFEADTYFNSTFDGSVHRLLVIGNSGKARSVLRNTIPNWDIAFVVVNHAMYGGSGGTWAVFSTHSSAPQIAIHEVGHSFANLADEYDYGGGGREGPNVTSITDRSNIKWKNWIKDSTPIPTPETNSYNNVIGLFEGASYEVSDWYRPKLNCMMKSLGSSFCEVCKEQTILTIYDLVEPYSGYHPRSGPIEISHNYQGLFEVDTRKLPANTISLNWYLDSSLVATNARYYRVRGAHLSDGGHVLIAKIADSTSMVRTDAVNKRTSELVWKLNVGQSLGLVRNFAMPSQIKLNNNFPNPFNPYTTFSFEIRKASNLTLTIYNMIGKKIKTFNMQSMPAGHHSVKWNATNSYGDPVSAGVYLYQLKTSEFVETRKMILLK